MATLDSVPTLLAQLHGRSRVQQAAAARALSELAQTDPGCTAIAAAGGAAALAAAVRSSGSTAVQQHALKAVLQFGIHGIEQQASVAASGAIPTLVQLMRRPGDLQSMAAGAICWLTCGQSSKECCDAVVAAGGTAAIISALQSSTHSIRRNAARTANNLAMDGFDADLLAAGVLPPLVALLTSSDAVERLDATTAIADLVQTARCSSAAVEAGVMPLLLAQLHSGCGSLQQNAVRALLNMLRHDLSARQAFMEQPGGLAALIGLLGGSSSSSSSEGGPASGGSSNGTEGELELCVCGALRNLAASGRQACASIVQAGGIPPLVSLLLTCADEGARQHALMALVCATAHTPCRSELLAAGAVPALRRILKRSTNSAHRALAAALGQLLCIPAAPAGGATDPDMSEAAALVESMAAKAMAALH